MKTTVIEFGITFEIRKYPRRSQQISLFCFAKEAVSMCSILSVILARFSLFSPIFVEGGGVQTEQDYDDIQ